jgi:transposase
MAIGDLLESVHCQLMFLPTYSTDLNLIEHFWFKIKNHVKKIKNEFENFIDAICYVLKKDTIIIV